MEVLSLAGVVTAASLRLEGEPGLPLEVGDCVSETAGIALIWLLENLAPSACLPVTIAVATKREKWRH